MLLFIDLIYLSQEVSSKIFVKIISFKVVAYEGKKTVQNYQKNSTTPFQCDQIGRLIALWATFAPLPSFSSSPGESKKTRDNHLLTQIRLHLIIHVRSFFQNKNSVFKFNWGKISSWGMIEVHNVADAKFH